MQEYTLTETTVDEINGVALAAGGAYKDSTDRKKKVNLTINRVPHPGLDVGDAVQFGNQIWKIAGFQKKLFAKHGTITLQRVE